MNVISRPQTFSVTSVPLPASRKIYLNGTAHTDVRVAMREIEVAAGKEPPVIVYDTSGPYSDPAITTDCAPNSASLPPRIPMIITPIKPTGSNSRVNSPHA